MSLYAALYSGTSGLAANSSALGIISDNITNVNTIGYKAADAEFMTLVTESSNYGSYSPGGVAARARSLIGAQGLLQTSTSATDLAIDGNGFFVVRPDLGLSDDVYFTRAGSFRPDPQGYLQNTAGMYLMGWPLDASGDYVDNGDVNVLSPINIASLTGTAEATTSAKIRANLQSSQEPYPATATPAYTTGSLADGTIKAHFSKTVKVYDSQGSSHNITMSFLKTENPNEWAVELHGDTAEVLNGTPPGVVASGTITFNEDGSLNLGASTAALFQPVDFDWANGASDSQITFNFGTDGQADGLTQFDSTSTMISSNIDGAVFGNVTGVSVGKDGVVTALFDNGLTRAVYKLPIATFQNPEGLQSVQGNAFARTDYSGDFELVGSGTGGAGQVSPKTLEASTVDLAKEFTKLITTQRAYSASARIITTADEMLTELNQLKR
ncbi:flagellar hook protein FlgE [Pedomonas mirosovicensis]|uniref:flagellar hook protein FlgE n=1 Tax=Pedomonas mirosovicensis TaxID=2908641 RepID=UPI0021684D13|nr:flagellar hook protein FlgE [Pedomonas mirosovicensis]MCH8685884.1 flagellar hook protein FlgE [Pedomonas mirosovicensis]